MYNQIYSFNINHLIKIRLHLGHREKTLNSKLTPYLYGIRHNIPIFNLDHLWKGYRYLFFSLIKNFAKRSAFFIIGTNKNLPMTDFLEDRLCEYPFVIDGESHSFYISGYIDKKWIGGLFTNWKIFNEFIPLLDRKNNSFKKRYRFLKYFFYLKGIKNLFKNPIPDFIVFLDNDVEALYELKKFQIPLIGLVDTDMNPDEYLYKFFGNNDSIENFEFFFEFLKETIKEGRNIEQDLFYQYFILKIKSKIYHAK